MLHYFPARAPADSHPSRISHQTLIIIIVCAAVGGIVLAVLLYRTIRSCWSRNVAPPPPVQPLAHQREQYLARFEASLRAQSALNSSFLSAPPPFSPPLGSPSLRGSKVSLIGSNGNDKDSPSSRHTSYAPTGEGAEELAILSPLETNSEALPVPRPSFTTSNLNSSSSINLNDTPSQLYTNPSENPSATGSPSRYSKTLSRLKRDDHTPSSPSSSQPHLHRAISLASTASRTNSRRRLPHGPYNQVTIVLPAPLASGISASSTRQNLSEHDSISDRRSIVDRWIPAGRDSILRAPAHESTASLTASWASTSSLAFARTPRRVSSNPHPLSGSEQNPHHQHYPSAPTSTSGDLAPPVPQVPSVHKERERNDREV